MLWYCGEGRITNYSSRTFTIEGKVLVFINAFSDSTCMTLHCVDFYFNRQLYIIGKYASSFFSIGVFIFHVDVLIKMLPTLRMYYALL